MASDLHGAATPAPALAPAAPTLQDEVSFFLHIHLGGRQLHPQWAEGLGSAHSKLLSPETFWAKPESLSFSYRTPCQVSEGPEIAAGPGCPREQAVREQACHPRSAHPSGTRRQAEGFLVTSGSSDMGLKFQLHSQVWTQTWHQQRPQKTGAGLTEKAAWARHGPAPAAQAQGKEEELRTGIGAPGLQTALHAGHTPAVLSHLGHLSSSPRAQSIHSYPLQSCHTVTRVAFQKCQRGCITVLPMVLSGFPSPVG